MNRHHAMKPYNLIALVCLGALPVSAQTTWNLGGNFVSPGQFLGSTNVQSLDLYVNGMRGLRIEPDPRPGGVSPNIVGGFTNNLIELPGSGGSVLVGGGWMGGPNLIRSNTSGAFIGSGSANEIGPNLNDGLIVGGLEKLEKLLNSSTRDER